MGGFASPVFQEETLGVPEALAVVVQEMLELKYGLSLDAEAFAQKVEEHCLPDTTSGIHDHHEGLQPSGVGDLVARLNLWPDMRFQAYGAEGEALVVAMRLDSLAMAAFEELRREVRRMPGTTRVLAVVGNSPTVARSAVARTSAPLLAVAVFREDYVRSDALVGRCSAPGAGPLLAFNAGDLRGAVVIDPHIVGVGPGKADIPPIRDEYASLGAWLLPEEAPRQMPPASYEVSPVAAHEPWREATVATSPKPPEADSVFGSPSSADSPSTVTPNYKWMRRLRRTLQKPREDEQASASSLLLLRQLNEWLRAGSTDIAVAARRAVLDSGLLDALAQYLRRTSASGPWGRQEVLAAEQACCAIGLSTRSSPDSFAAFNVPEAVSAICGFMRRFLADADVQLACALAFRELLEEDAAASGAVAAAAASVGAPRLLRAALSAHPHLQDLQRDANRALQLLAPPQQAAAEREPGAAAMNTRQAASPADGEGAATLVSRRGLADALLEQRAAEAARGSVVSQAVGWLFSGRSVVGAAASSSSASTSAVAAMAGRSATMRQGASEPPGLRGPPVPAPCVPAPAAAAVPRLDLRVMLQPPKTAQPTADPMLHATGEFAGSGAGLASAATGGGLRSVSRSRLRPLVDGSPEGESPHTPPAVRLRQRSGAGTEADGGTTTAAGVTLLGH